MADRREDAAQEQHVLHPRDLAARLEEGYEPVAHRLQRREAHARGDAEEHAVARRREAAADKQQHGHQELAALLDDAHGQHRERSEVAQRVVLEHGGRGDADGTADSEARGDGRERLTRDVHALVHEGHEGHRHEHRAEHQDARDEMQVPGSHGHQRQERVERQPADERAQPAAADKRPDRGHCPAGICPSVTLRSWAAPPRASSTVTRASGRCAASATATSSTVGVGRPSSLTSTSARRMPARAAGPPGMTAATRTPPVGSERSSRPSDARPESTTRPRATSCPAICLTVFDEIANPIPSAAAPLNSGSVAASVGMPMTAPVASTSAPPLLPGLIGALVWITAGRATPPPSLTVRLVALTMPCVTLERRPSGLPIASAYSPTRTREESAKVAGRSLALGTDTTARSPWGKEPTSAPGWVEPSARVTRKVFEPATTCALVTTWPAVSSAMPEPSPRELWIWTTEGIALATTSPNPRAAGAAGGGATLEVTPPQPDAAGTQAVRPAAISAESRVRVM